MAQLLVAYESVKPRRTRCCVRTVVFGAALVLAACGSEEAKEEVPVPPLPVKMYTVPAGGVEGTIEYPGRIQAWLHSEMAFENGGRITEFRVVEGDEVEEGDILVRLDPRDFEADLQKARATRAQANADFDRYKVLYKEGVASKAEYEAREEHYKVAQADVQRAEKALEDADLIAPFSGRIARKLVEDFQNVRMKQPVLILQDVSRLKIKTAVPESDLAGNQRNPSREEINSRIRAFVIVSTAADRSFPAELGELALTADPTTRTFDATFYFDSPTNANILPGMTAKVRVNFSAEGTETHRVPGAAIWSDDNGNPRVWRVDPATKTVEEVEVELGNMAEEFVEIRGGIEDGDIVAISGVNDLRTGRLVREYVR